MGYLRSLILWKTATHQQPVSRPLHQPGVIYCSSQEIYLSVLYYRGFYCAAVSEKCLPSKCSLNKLGAACKGRVDATRIRRRFSEFHGTVCERGRYVISWLTPAGNVFRVARWSGDTGRLKHVHVGPRTATDIVPVEIRANPMSSNLKLWEEGLDRPDLRDIIRAAGLNSIPR